MWCSFRKLAEGVPRNIKDWVSNIRYGCIKIMTKADLIEGTRCMCFIKKLRPFLSSVGGKKRFGTRSRCRYLTSLAGRLGPVLNLGKTTTNYLPQFINYSSYFTTGHHASIESTCTSRSIYGSGPPLYIPRLIYPCVK